MKKTAIALGIILILGFVKVTDAGEVRCITLENGLDLVMMPDASSPLLSCLVIVRTGSSYETLATAGATHLLEHMMFRGTKTRSQGDIYDSMDLMGAYYNAQTSKTYTNYILVVPREHALQAMQIQADMVLHSTVPADTFKVEKGRVIAEIQQTYNRSSYPADVAHLLHVYGNTSYSFPTLGSVNGIREINRDEVARFHHDWYAVNNMTLVLRGDLGFSEMEKLAREVYGSEPARTLPERPESWPVGFDDWHQGQTHFTYGDVRRGTVTVSFQAPSFDDADYPAYSLIQSFLDERLGKAFKEREKSPVTYIYSSIVNDLNFSVLEITAGLSEASEAQSVVDEIVKTVYGIAEMQFTSEMLAGEFEDGKRAGLFFAEQVQYGSFLLVPKLAIAPYGFWEDFEARQSKIRRMTAMDVASRWFADPFYVASVYLPRVDEEESAGGVTLGEVKTDTLDNGLIVIARQVAGAPVAGIHVVVKHRALWEGDNRRGWGDLLHRLLEQGYGEMDQAAFRKEISEIGMEISTVDDPRVPMDNYRTVPDYSFIRIQVLADRWSAALALLGKVFESPHITDEDVEAVKTEQQGIIGNGEKRVSSLAGKEFGERLYGDHYLTSSVYGDGSSHETANGESLAEFYDIYFSPDNLIISILSPAPNDEVFEIAESAFDDLIATRFSAPKFEPPKSTPGETEVSGKGRQGYLASGFLLGEVADEDVPALMIANSMVSDLIYRDLGEKKGWAYGAGCSLTLRPGWGAWKVSMGLSAEHLEESRDIVYQHLATIATGDFDEHRMEVARQSILGKVLRRYSSRINLTMALGHDAFIYNDPLYTWNTYDRLKEVTLDQVKQAAGKYLSSSENAVTVIGKPEPGDMKERKMPPGMMMR